MNGSGATAVGAGGGTGAGTAPGSTGLASLLGINNQQLQQLQAALSAAGGSFGGQANSANYMRAGMPAQLAQGQPNNLLATILQMRAQQAAAQGSPYQTGVMAPQMSLLR